MTVFEICMLVLSVVLGAFSLYLKTKKDLLDKTGQFIADAENLYRDTTAAGGQKFEWVVDQLYGLVPAPLRMVFSRDLIGNLVQSTFDTIQHYAKLQLDKIMK